MAVDFYRDGNINSRHQALHVYNHVLSTWDASPLLLFAAPLTEPGTSNYGK